MSKKPLVELVMIVKNSGEDIISMLQSVKPYVDRWTILDTGSTDRTKENITKTMEGKLGLLYDGMELYQDPFVDFSTSRNRVLDLAGAECEFTIMLDDTFHLVNGKEFRKTLKKLRRKSKFSAWPIIIEDEQSGYISTRIFRSRDKIRYKYKIHEVPNLPTEKIGRTLDNVSIKDVDTSFMKRRSQSRALRDIRLLSEELTQNPRDRRLRFHLARTMSTCAALTEEDRTLGTIAHLDLIIIDKKRDTWDHEARLLKSMIKMDSSQLNLGMENELKILARDYQNCAEIPYLLAVFYRVQTRVEEAYEWIMKAANVSPFLRSGRTINMKIHKFEIPYLCADLCIAMGKLDVAEKILKTYAPKNNDTRLLNMIYAISNVPQPRGRTLNAPIVVIHTTSAIKGWSPTNIRGIGEVHGSGSEIMAINVAQALARKGYRVFIFGDFEGAHNEEQYDTQCMHKGVQYMDEKKYWDFLKQFIVDILIVSRDIHNLVYLNNVRKAYLWVHDVLPSNSVVGGLTIQYHKEKFKKIMCLCDWHANEVQRRLGVPDERLYTTRNAILPQRFSRRPKKIPHRYIYTSSADRGLDNLLDMIPRIKQEFPETSLHLFCSIENTAKGDAESLKRKISELDYVFLHNRVSQEELAHELLISDIWLYPTDFTETYCITALEAQAAGLLCVSTDVAALKEIVANRGILVSGNGSDPKVREKMLQELFRVLRDSKEKERLVESGRNWAHSQGFDELADEWIRDLFKL